MSVPILSPASQTSTVILPATGTTGDVTSANLPFGLYATDGKLENSDFVAGAVAQVSYTYRKLGGDVLDIELKAQQVYAAYEEAVFEYSYIVNLHQSKNMLSNVLGNTTGTFDHHGELVVGSTLSSSLGHDNNVALKYTRFEFGYARHVAAGHGAEVGIGGNKTVYSSSIDITEGRQDYDLQSIVATKAATDSYLADPNNRKIIIKRVYYKSPRAIWRFYGYFGGIGTVGNLGTYGQYADDSTWQIVPVWQNKAQAAAYEDAIYTRTSHFSYEIRNNKIRLYPSPSAEPSQIWFEYSITQDAWEEDSDRKFGASGINNMNTIPLANIKFKNINSIGKQWIRRFALALTKEMLGHVRGKFSVIPIPGESVTLNHSELLSQAKEEQEKLREELRTILEDMTYDKLLEKDAAISEHSAKIFEDAPMGIYIR